MHGTGLPAVSPIRGAWHRKQACRRCMERALCLAGTKRYCCRRVSTVLYLASTSTLTGLTRQARCSLATLLVMVALQGNDGSHHALSRPLQRRGLRLVISARIEHPTRCKPTHT